VADEKFSNVIQLFPNPTDRQYEDEIVPTLVDVLGRLAGDAQNGNYERLNSIADSLYRYSIRSLITLDLQRRDGLFDDGKLPPVNAYDVDNLAADCALVMGGDEELVNKLRDRTLVGGGADE